VAHPIHDQSFYLTLEHKSKLKEEFGKYVLSKFNIRQPTIEYLFY